MNDETKLKTHDILLLVLLGMMFILGVVSFFMSPKYVAGEQVAFEAIKDGLLSVFAFKFGIHQTQVPAGTVQVTKTVNPPDPDPKPADPAKE